MMKLIVLINFCATVYAQSWHQKVDYEYFIALDQVSNYDAAASSCASKQATLAVINTREIQEFLQSSISSLLEQPNLLLYIGLKRSSNGNFRWVDGSSVSNGYTNWFSTNQNGKNCVTIGYRPAIGSFFRWWYTQCSVRGGYICQRGIFQDAPTTTDLTTTTTTKVNKQTPEIVTPSTTKPVAIPGNTNILNRSPTASLTTGSPQPWLQYGIYEYLIETAENFTFESANRECIESGANLVVINAEDVQEFLVSQIAVASDPGHIYISRESVSQINNKVIPLHMNLYESEAPPIANVRHSLYIGMSRKTNGNSDFVWVNGTAVSDGYTNWHSSQPKAKDCAVMGYIAQLSSYFDWWSTNCSTLNGYICQREIVTEATIVLPTNDPQLWLRNGDYEYFIERNASYNYTSSSKFCADNDGTLAVINNSSIQEFVISQIGFVSENTRLQLYIGMRRRTTGNLAFEWVNGTTVADGYTNWYSNQPSNNQENDCAIMGYIAFLESNFNWWSTSCFNLGGFICQRKIVTVTPTTFPTISPKLWLRDEGYEYFIERDASYNYSTSSKVCAKNEATLVVINSESVQNFLVSQINFVTDKELLLYMGMRRRTTGNLAFEWVNGTKVTDGYTNWYSNQPSNNRAKSCALLIYINSIDSKFKWWSTGCSTLGGYVCQRKIITATPTLLPTITPQLWLRSGDYDYFIERNASYTYSFASKICAANDATLAVVSTEKVQIFLASKISVTSATRLLLYIGMKRGTTGNLTFEWVNGTTVSNGYTNWFSNQPSIISGKDCAVMGYIASLGSDFSWWSTSCSTLGGYICQRAIATVSSQAWLRYDQYEYFIESKTSYNYASSSMKCMQDDASLAVVNNREIQQFLVNNVNSTGSFKESASYIFYIGLNRDNTRDFSFEWSDGAKLSDGFTNWYPQKPSDHYSGKYCVAIIHHKNLESDFRWWDIDCSTVGGYICQRELDREFDYPIAILEQESWHRHGEYEYFLESNSTYTYKIAEKLCSENDANLAVINSNSTQKFLVENIDASLSNELVFYIGLKRNNFTFEWVDGTSISDGYSKWYKGRPTNQFSNQNCVIMGYRPILRSYFDWWDLRCNSLAGFICQRKPRIEEVTTIHPILNLESWRANGTYEYFIEMRKNYNYATATRHCEENRARLAVIDSEEVQEFLVSSLGHDSAKNNILLYIGLKANSSGLDFKWVNGIPIAYGYSNWFIQHPKGLNSGKNCAAIAGSNVLESRFHWWSISCSSPGGYICQRRTSGIGNNDYSAADFFTTTNIIIICASVIVFAMLLLTLIYFVRKRKRRERQDAIDVDLDLIYKRSQNKQTIPENYESTPMYNLTSNANQTNISNQDSISIVSGNNYSGNFSTDAENAQS